MQKGWKCKACTQNSVWHPNYMVLTSIITILLQLLSEHTLQTLSIMPPLWNNTSAQTNFPKTASYHSLHLMQLLQTLQPLNSPHFLPCRVFTEKWPRPYARVMGSILQAKTFTLLCLCRWARCSFFMWKSCVHQAWNRYSIKYWFVMSDRQRESQ